MSTMETAQRSLGPQATLQDPEQLLTGRVLLEMLAEFRPAALQARLASPDRLFPLLDLYVDPAHRSRRQGRPLSLRGN